MLRPKGVSLHYEVELGVVIGKQVRDLDPADEKEALDAIAGELYHPYFYPHLSPSAPKHTM